MHKQTKGKKTTKKCGQFICVGLIWFGLHKRKWIILFVWIYICMCIDTFEFEKKFNCLQTIQFYEWCVLNVICKIDMDSSLSKNSKVKWKCNTLKYTKMRFNWN